LSKKLKYSAIPSINQPLLLAEHMVSAAVTSLEVNWRFSFTID